MNQQVQNDVECASTPSRDEVSAEGPVSSPKPTNVKRIAIVASTTLLIIGTIVAVAAGSSKGNKDNANTDMSISEQQAAVAEIPDTNAPTLSNVPSLGPSLSGVPTLAPTLSSNPSQMPSTSIRPSSVPSTSMEPSNAPSSSIQPSIPPSTSMAPSQMPSRSFDFLEYVPDVRSTDISDVMSWIKTEVTMVKNPYCWRRSYGRGVGVPLSRCPPGKEKIGLLCYSPCPAGFARFGFDCHAVCPDGSRDDGLFCRWAEYGRGVGYPWVFGDPLNDSGMFRRCESDHGSGKCEKCLLIVYPKCNPGDSPIGCNICRPPQPNCAAYGNLGGQFDLSCAKQIRIGDPTPMICAEGLEEDAGLCYTPCDDTFSGVGPVCWGDCDDSQVDCGAACAISSTECAAGIFEQVLAPIILAANIASMGLATPATAGASATINIAGKTVAGTTRVGKLFVKAVKMLQTVGKIEKAGDGAEAFVQGFKVARRFRNAKTGSYEAMAVFAYKIVANGFEWTDTITNDADYGMEVYRSLHEYKVAFADDFAAQTSQEINNIIDSRFNPETGRFLKETWAEYSLHELAVAEAWEIADAALGTISLIDITGVFGLISAYAKPICNDIVPFVDHLDFVL